VVPLADLDIDRTPESGFSHLRYNRADIKHPVILDGDDDRLLDGRHRLAKIEDAGGDHAPAVRATREQIDAATVKPVVGGLKQADLADGVTLQPHQQRIVDKTKKQLDETGKSRLLLYHSLGSGKTLSGLAAADATETPYTAVVPAALRDNMRKEQAKFLDPNTSPPGDVVSYSGLALGHPVPNGQSILLDEAHRLRNPESGQTQRVMRLADKARQLTILTGTPVVNDPGDFAPLYGMLTGKKLTPDEFHQKFVREEPVTPGLVRRLFGAKAEGPGVRNEKELRQQLAGKIDYHAPLAAKATVKEEDVVTEMGRDQARLYKHMYGNLPALLRWKIERQYPISKDEAVRMQGFLTGPRQVGLSTLPFMKGRANPQRAFDRSPKLQEAMKRLKANLDTNPEAKALVFSNFIGAGLEPYQKALERAGIPAASFTGGLNDQQRKELVEQYNANKLRVALIGPAGTEGLSFRGTRLVQLLDPHWNNVRGRQSIGRGVRFDSHDHLDPADRNVVVQRFISRLPPEGLARLGRLVGLGGKPRLATDDYLTTMARRKDQVNERFLGLLKEVGSADG
jgi:superfamily II DNA or RNA helicase